MQIRVQAAHFRIHSFILLNMFIEAFIGRVRNTQKMFSQLDVGQNVSFTLLHFLTVGFVFFCDPKVTHFGKQYFDSRLLQYETIHLSSGLSDRKKTRNIPQVALLYIRLIKTVSGRRPRGAAQRVTRKATVFI